MTMRFRVLMAAMTAALALSFAVGTASALRSLSISGSTTLTLNSRLTFASEAVQVICNATVTTTVSRVIPKIEHILIGKVTRVEFSRTLPEANCRSSVSRLSNLQVIGLEREERARILKSSILGTLPNITGVLFYVDGVQASFTTDTEGRCGYEAPEPGVAVLAEVEARGNIGNLRFERYTAVRIEGGIFCPRTGEFVGTLIPLQTTNVRLI
jgi:hypothetical protein